MKPPKLAPRDCIRLFSIYGQNVAVVIGQKPRNYELPHLTKQGERRLVLEFSPGEEAILANGDSDAYVVVQPVRVTAELGDVEVWHADGCDRVGVESLARDERAVPEGVFGISQDFSLEAAVKDALSRLTPEAQREPQLFDVVSMGALYGGFSGFSRLFIRMSPADIQLAESIGGQSRMGKKSTPVRRRCHAVRP